MNKPSHRQQDVYNTWDEEDCNILIGAVAGSGKTTTLMEILRRCESRALFLAFNKSIQEEIQGRIDNEGMSQGKALTLHSLGLKALKTKYSRPFVKPGKNWDLLKKLQDNLKPIFKKIPWDKRLPLSWAILDLNDLSRLFLTNDLKELEKHFLSVDKIFPTHKEIKTIWREFIKIRTESYTIENPTIDFIDMIYLPVVENLTIPIRCTYLMVDEAQDLNLCQHKLIDNLIGQGDIKKWIAVGDRNQSIYAFSGAYSSSFDMFLHKEGKVKELPLDINYRSAKKIVEAANKVYDVMENFHENDGIVGKLTEPALIKPKSMVVCRNISPLIDLYFRLIALKKPCFIKGEDILAGVLRFLKPYKKDTVDSLDMEIEFKISKLANSKEDKDRMKVYKLKENQVILKILAKHFCKNNRSVDALMLQLKTLFVSKNNAVTLCSIHKSKGLEADVVYILNEHLIPSKFAKSPEQLTQEANLKYVARTRAKKEMYYLTI